MILFFVLSREDETSFEMAGPPTTQAGAEAAAEATDTAPSTTDPVVPRRVGVNARIDVRGGRPADGVRRLVLQRGGPVVLVVSSDTRDQVHVHGYDLTRDVAPGAPARIAFRAKIAGRFEIELEERGVRIAELEVRP